MNDYGDRGPGADIHAAQLAKAVQITRLQLEEAKRLHQEAFGNAGSAALLAAIVNAIALNYAAGGIRQSP